MANAPSRQKEKRKQQSLGDVQVIDLCSSDDDNQAKVSVTAEPCTVYALAFLET